MICLADREYKTKKKFTVVGWGDTEKKNNEGKLDSKVLLKMKINLLPFDDCKKKFNSTEIRLIDTQFCDDNTNGSETCKGDSGGPSFTLISRDSVERHTQNGIVSVKRKDTCGFNPTPTVYTKVFSYYNWIVDHMEP